MVPSPHHSQIPAAVDIVQAELFYLSTTDLGAAQSTGDCPKGEKSEGQHSGNQHFQISQRVYDQSLKDNITNFRTEIFNNAS